MISQSLFDETLLENQDVFEYTDDEALKETIDEFLQQQPHHRLEHLSLTHPSSPRGKKDREIQKLFVKSLETESRNIAVATSILEELQHTQSSDTKRNNKESDDVDIHKTRLLSLWFLMLQYDLGTKLMENFDAIDGISKAVPLLNFIAALFPDSSLSLHPLARDLKRAIAPSWFDPSRNDVNEVSDETSAHETTSNIWFHLFEESLGLENCNEITFSLSNLARKLTNGCEENKKSFVKGSLIRCDQSDDKVGLELLIGRLGDVEPIDIASFASVREICRLIAVLSKFQPLAEPNEPSCTPEAPTTGGAPLVSSAHANVKEFHKMGAVPRLHRIAKECLQGLRQDEEDSNSKTSTQMNRCQLQELLSDSLAALRAMAIDNDIVQNMIALGILDTVRDGLEIIGQVVATRDENLQPSSDQTSTLGLATATMGLVRNLCANDEVKTTICKSSLPSILHVMQQFLSKDGTKSIIQDDKPLNRRTNGHAILQEHSCGILAAMALRQPQNAHAIIEGGGHILIFEAMQAFPNKVTLQRQGCLAVRNIASRLSRMSYDEDKTKLLDAGAEHILQNIAGKHPASAEEAYAALRDLGCNPQMYQLDEYGNTTRSTSEAFGSVKSNFRPVYE